MSTALHGARFPGAAGIFHVILETVPAPPIVQTCGHVGSNPRISAIAPFMEIAEPGLRLAVLAGVHGIRRSAR